MKKDRKYYDILGVKPDASQDEIKKAFRSRAKDCHPDHHPGDKEKEAEFKEISAAYAVLSDPDARRHYDETGDPGQVDNMMAEVYGLIIQTFQKVREQNGNDILFQDPLERMKQLFRKGETEARAAIEEYSEENRRIDKLLKKIIHKKGNQQSFLHVALAEEKKSNEFTISNIERAIAVMSRATAILDEYRFDADKRPSKRNVEFTIDFGPQNGFAADISEHLKRMYEDMFRRAGGTL